MARSIESQLAPVALGIVGRRFTRPGTHPADAIEWQTRDAAILGEDGTPVFEQRGVEVPATWSAAAINVVASKYFRGQLGTSSRESSVRQMIGRVVDAIAGWAREGDYFAGEEDVSAFADELYHLLLHQMASFNSPVWFNVGIEARPQCSACFINAVEDTMPSILGLVATEGMLFKYGSGSGSNLSRLRSSREPLGGGGTASGPVSFMKGFDAFAGVIKSGGKTRRAAKMVILDADHPDILEFIRAKVIEEKKAWALIEAGYDGGFEVAAGAYDSIAYQNANHSVRVDDDFMRAVEDDATWTSHAVTTGEPMDTYQARELLGEIAEAVWVCGDPGIQFDTTINDWHTCANTAPIRASNPCSEYMFLDNSACNLSSINVMRFYDSVEDRFDVEGFRHACEVMVTAQEILVDAAGYPTEAIAANSRDYRPLGLGLANLGALLMARGLAYDSDAGRAYAAAITALLSGAGYAQSARIATHKGPFAGFEANRQPMLRVMERHRDAVQLIAGDKPVADISCAAQLAWDEVVASAKGTGLRNAQISVIAPTGTIAFMMDCDTTGIEPDIALVKYKRLVGGGTMKIVNRTVPIALARLGYGQAEIGVINEHIEDQGTIEGAPGFDAGHLPVFDCALRPAAGTRAIHYRGHLAMIAAVQPFVSGAISKTINMPENATPDEIAAAYTEAWRLGIKAIAVYRDGSKRSQPLSTRGPTDAPSVKDGDRPRRRKLADERRAITHKFSVGGHEGYLTVGLYDDDGQPGEIFLVMAKEGSTISGLMDAFATSVSIALQYGVPLKTLVDKFSHTRFEPSGFTNNREIPIAKSITDYIARWLASKFLDRSEQALAGVVLRDDEPQAKNEESPSAVLFQQDAPSCPDCGAIMVRSGTCYRCLNCGASSGCS